MSTWKILWYVIQQLKYTHRRYLWHHEDSLDSIKSLSCQVLQFWLKSWLLRQIQRELENNDISSTINLCSVIETESIVSSLSMLFNVFTSSRSWLKILSSTSKLLTIRRTVSCDASFFMHVAETLSSFFFVTQMRAKKSRNFRFSKRSLDISILCESWSRSCIMRSSRTEFSMQRRTTAWMKWLRRLSVISMTVIWFALCWFWRYEHFRLCKLSTFWIEWTVWALVLSLNSLQTWEYEQVLLDDCRILCVSSCLSTVSANSLYWDETRRLVLLCLSKL